MFTETTVKTAVTKTRTPLIQDMGILCQESDGIYHAQADRFLSSHQLMDFIRCPLLFRKKKLGLIDNTETPTFLVGKAAHVRILEGFEAYQDRFALGGPINPTTGKPYGSLTKKFAEWRDIQQKPVLSQDQADLVEQMDIGVQQNGHAVALISQGVAEGIVRTEYCGLPCQIRIDWLNPYRGIVDLKTCDDLTYFEADARRYKYHHQLAFYQAVLKEATGVLVPVHLIAIEKKEPFRCGVWRMSDDCLATARRDNEAAIERLKSCRAENVWPTGYEEIRVLDIF